MPNPRPNDLPESEYERLKRLFSDDELTRLSVEQVEQLTGVGNGPAAVPVAAVEAVQRSPQIRNRGRNIAVDPALANFQSSAARAGGVYDPDAAQLAGERAAVFERMPFTTGGEQTAGTAVSMQQQETARELAAAMDLLGVNPVDVARGTAEPEGVGGLIGSLLPQTIETPGMNWRQAQSRELSATQQAIEQFAMLHELELPTVVGYNQQMGAHPLVKERARQILAGEVSSEPMALALEGGYQQQTPLDEVQSYAKEFARDWASSAIESAGVRQLRHGESIETPAAQVGRLMAAPTSMAVGAVESAVTGKPLLTAMAERTTKGMGFMGGGIDFGRWSGGALADALDLPADSESRENLETAGAFVGGALGFGGELLVPIDLGATRLATAAGKIIRRGQAVADMGVDASRLSRTFAADVGEQYARLPEARQAAQQLIDIQAAQSAGRGLDEAVEMVAGAGATERVVTQRLRAAGVLDEFESLPAGVARLKEESSSLANRAAVDALTYGARRQLVEGGALRSGKILSDIARTFTPDDVQLLSPKLKEALKVPKVSDDAPPLADLSTEARKAVERQILFDASDRLLRQRGAGSEEVRRGFSGMVLFEPSAAKAADKKLKSTVMGDIAGALANKGRRYLTREGGINFGLMSEDLNQPNLLEDLADFLNTGRLVEVNPSDLRIIDRGRYHDLLMPAVDQWYKAQPGSRSVSAAVKGLERVSDGRDAGRLTAASGEKGRRLFTPPELRSTFIHKTAMDKYVKWQNETQSFDPTIQVLADELGDKMGSIDKDYLMKMKSARREGYTGPNAYAAVWWRNYSTTDDISRGIEDLISNYYGAFEDLGTATRSTQATSSSFRLATVEASSIRRVIDQVLQVLRTTRPAGLEDLADLVVDTERLLMNAATDTNAYMGALVNLRDIAGRLENVSLQDLATATGARLPGNPEKYSDALPIFDVSRFHDLTAATYLQRRAAVVVDEVFDVNRPEMQGLMGPVDAPELFGNFETFLQSRGLELDRPAMARVLKAIIGDISAASSSGNTNAWDKTRRALNRVGRETAAGRRPPFTAQDAQEIGAGSQLFSWVNSRLTRLRPEQRPAWDNMARRYLEFIARETTTEGPVARLRSLGMSPQELSQMQGKLGLENFTDLIAELSRDHQPFFNRLKAWIVEAIDGTGKVSLWSKGGMLGGRVLANMRYMGMNALTAPAIIYSTMGARYSAAGMKGWINSDAWHTLKQIVRPGGVAEDSVLFTAPDGRIWTAQDMAQLVQTRIRSQGSAELSRRVLDDILAESQIFARDLGVDFDKDKMLHGRQWMKSSIRRAAEKYTGLRVERGREGLGLLPEVTVGMNAFNEIADLTDQGFRIGVAVEALKAGRPVDEAVKLASESLFDYGRMSALERKTFAKAFWFWSFQRESLRNVLLQGLENPHRLRASYIASQGIPEDRQFHATTKDYLENRPFIALLDRENIQQRWSAYGPAIPMADGLAQVVDTMSVAALLFNGVLHAATGEDLIETGRLDLGTTVIDRSLQQTNNALRLALQTYAGNAPPHYQAFIGLTFNIDARREGQKISRYLDPRMVYYFQLHPELWEIFTTVVEVEGTRPTSDKFGTYRGMQWEIAEDSVDDWYLLQAAFLMGGVQRTMKDYAPLVYEAVTALNMSDPALVPDYRLNPEVTDIPAFNQLLYQSGLVTVTDERSPEELYDANQAAMVRMLQRAEVQ